MDLLVHKCAAFWTKKPLGMANQPHPFDLRFVEKSQAFRAKIAWWIHCIAIGPFARICSCRRLVKDLRDRHALGGVRQRELYVTNPEATPRAKFRPCQPPQLGFRGDLLAG